MRSTSTSLLLVCLAALAGCGGSGPGPTGTVTGSSTATGPTPSPTPVPTATATATPAPPATPSPVAGLPTCAVSQLTVTPGGSQGATGHVGLVMSFTDHGAPCHLTGYPGMLLLDFAGHALPTTVKRGGGFIYGNQPVVDVALSAGQAAYAGVEYEDVEVNGETCPNPTQAEVTPPNDVDHAIVPFTGHVCSQGTLWVTPVEPAPPTR